MILSRQWKRLSVDAPPASCPPCHYFCQKDLLTLIIASMTSQWRHMTSCDITSLHQFSCQTDGQKDRRTDGQMDGTENIASTANAAGNKESLGPSLFDQNEHGDLSEIEWKVFPSHCHAKSKWLVNWSKSRRAPLIACRVFYIHIFTHLYHFWIWQGFIRLSIIKNPANELYTQSVFQLLIWTDTHVAYQCLYWATFVNYSWYQNQDNIEYKNHRS